jgi:hypothetical protein
MWLASSMPVLVSHILLTERTVMPKVAVTVEHHLSRSEARNRIDKLLRCVHDLGGTWQERWTSDTCLHFTGKLHGQTMAGEVSVEDRAVKAMVMLPWTLALLAGRVKAVLEQSARQALAGS